MKSPTDQDAIPNLDAKLGGLKRRPLLAKTIICVVLTMMSVYVIYDNYLLVNPSYPIFKFLGVLLSYLLLGPSLYDAYLMGHMLISMGDNEFHDEFFEKVENDWGNHCCWCCGANCFLICCCPLSWCCLFRNEGLSARCTAAVIGTTDICQTLILFPLTAVVINTSESGVDVFVNVIAVQVFANLDDIFAYGITDRREEMWKKTSKLYFKWIGERKTPDDVDVSAFNALREEVRLIKKTIKFVDNKSLAVVENKV